MYFSWNVEEYLPQGLYQINIYADSLLIGNRSFSLEN